MSFTEAWAYVEDGKDEGYLYYLEQLRQTDIHAQSDTALYYAGQLLQKSLVPDSLAINLLRLGDVYRVRNAYDLAREQLHIFDSIFTGHKLNDSLLLAKRIYLQAKILTTQGAFNEALPFHDSCIQIKSRILGPNHIRLAKVYNYRGINYHYTHDYDEAMRNYQQGLAICELNGVEGVDMADIMQNMAILFTNQSEFDKAIHAINKSKNIREEILPDNSFQLATFYINYGRFLTLAGELQKSLDYYLLADQILLQHDYVDPVIFGTLYNNLGILFEVKRDLQKASLYFIESLSKLRSVHHDAHPMVLSAKINLGHVKLAQDNHQEAMELFDEIMDEDLNPFTRLILLRHYARAHRYNGDNEKAARYFEESVAFARKSLGSLHFETANALIRLAEHLLEHRNPGSALTHFEEAYEIFVSNFGKGDREAGYALINMARCYDQLGEYARADQLLQQVDTVFQPVVDQMIQSQAFENLAADVRIVGYPAARASLYKAWYAQDRDIEKLYKSLHWVEQGMSLVERIGMGTADESRLLLNEQIRELLQDALDVNFTLFQLTSDTSMLEHAFALAGRSKAAVLLSSIRRLNALQAGGVPSQVTKLESEFNEQMAIFRKLVYNEEQKQKPNTERINFLESRYFELSRKYDSLVKTIEKDYPDYYALRYDKQVVSVQEVKDQLGTDETLLEYVLTDAHLYVFSANKDNIYLYRTNAAGIIEDVSAMLDHTKPDLAAHRLEDYHGFVSRSQQLYEQLIQPFEHRVKGKRLIIIPDGILGYLPFELLLPNAVTETERIDYNSLPYLIKTNPVSYAYSATLRFSPAQIKEERAGSGLLAFVPAYENKPLTGTASEDEIFNLSPLPFALQEARQVQSVFGGKMLYADDASKQKFLDQAAGYDVLHLAMHAQINDHNPLYSRLIFQPLSDSIDDFTLSTSELYGLQLNARMVVLSACNTGAGQLMQGEGVMSLTRGFVYAGVPSIVMTAWEVHDESGAVMMERFYHYLHKGLTKDVALQKAKLDFLEQANILKSHPYFWAAYVVIGDTEKLYSKGTAYFTWWWVSGLIVLVFLLGYLRYFRAQKKSVSTFL